MSPGPKLVTLYFTGLAWAPSEWCPLCQSAHTEGRSVSKAPQSPRAGLHSSPGIRQFGPPHIQVVCAGWLREHRDRPTQPNRLPFISPQCSAFKPHNLFLKQQPGCPRRACLHTIRGTRRPGKPQCFRPPELSLWSPLCTSEVWRTKGNKSPLLQSPSLANDIC